MIIGLEIGSLLLLHQPYIPSGFRAKGNYLLQVEQLRAEHVLQGLLSPSWGDTPPVFPEGALKEEKIRLAPLWQLGHGTASPDWLKERSNSNLESQ